MRLEAHVLVQPEPEELPKGKNPSREVLEAFVVEVLVPCVLMAVAFITDSWGWAVVAVLSLAAGMAKARGDMHGELAKVYQSMYLLSLTLQSQQNEIERLKRDVDA